MGLRSSVAALLLASATPVVAQAQPPAEVVVPAAATRWKVGGDFRLRGQADVDVPGTADRYRLRLRARVGVEYFASDEVTLGARVRTGSRDHPENPYVELGHGFDDFEVGFDRAYARWRPVALGGVELRGGKFETTLVDRSPYGAITWDGDIQPEGAAVVHERRAVGDGDWLRVLRVAGGAFLAAENRDGPDVWLGALQATATARVSERFDVQAGANLEVYGDPTAGGTQLFVQRNRGNALTADGTAFVSDFTLVTGFVGVDVREVGTPVALTFEVVENVGAAAGIDGTALVAAVAVGATADGPGRFHYQWLTVGQDALFSPLAIDDFPLTTDHRTNAVGWDLELSRDVVLALTAFATEELGTDADPRFRARVDLTFRF